MDEYINKQAAFVTLVFSDALEDMTCGQMAKVLDVIKTVPTADVAPVVHGRWTIEDCHAITYPYCCSNCKAHHRARYDFCPSCGAKMDWKEGDGDD